MPTVTEDIVRAYAHCQSAKCIGNKQQDVDGIRTTTVYTYIDLGGDLPGPERSTERVRYADNADAVCPHCDGPREISEQPRPQYAPVSGQAQDTLLHLGETQARVRDVEHAREVDELKRELEMRELKSELAEMKALLADKANKPGPKARAA